MSNQHRFCCPDKVGQQRWQVNISNAVQDGALTLNVSDSIGNYRTMLLQLDVDITAPECVLDSILVAGINYVGSAGNASIACVDDNLGEVQLLQSPGSSVVERRQNNTFSLNYSSGVPISLLVIDEFNNTRSYEYTIMEDTTAPQITGCVFGNSTLKDGSYYLMNNGGVMVCNLFDSVGFNLNYSIVLDPLSTTPTILTSGVGTSFTTQQIVLPSLTDGRLIRVDIYMVDELGNSNNIEYLFETDKTPPSLGIQPTDGEQRPLIGDAFVHDQGYLMVRTSDKNNVRLSIVLECDSLVLYNQNSFVNTTIDLSTLQLQACDERMQATMVSVDDAQKTVAMHTSITELTEQHLNSL